MASTTAVGRRPGVPSAAGGGSTEAETGGPEARRMRRFDLAKPGAVARSLSAEAHTADRETGPLYEAWRAELTGG